MSNNAAVPFNDTAIGLNMQISIAPKIRTWLYDHMKDKGVCFATAHEAVRTHIIQDMHDFRSSTGHGADYTFFTCALHVLDIFKDQYLPDDESILEPNTLDTLA